MTSASHRALGDGSRDNARRLLTLADHARDAGDVGHAYALTIIAWEEFAKCFIYRNVEVGNMTLQLPPGSSPALIVVDPHVMSRHREKHAVVAASLFGMALQGDLLPSRPFVPGHAAALDPLQLAGLTTERLQAALPENMRPENLPQLAQKVSADPKLVAEVLRLAQVAGSWDRERSRGLYVDLVNDKVQSPADITSSELQGLRALLDGWLSFNGGVIEGYPEPMVKILQQFLPRLYDATKLGRRFLLCDPCLRKAERGGLSWMQPRDRVLNTKRSPPSSRHAQG